MIDDLLNKAEEAAEEEADGHLTLLRFTTGWKVCFGTPDLDAGGGRDEVAGLPAFDSLDAALADLLEVRRKV